MKAEEIKSYFPLELKATQEILDSKKNIGESLLKSFFPSEIHADIFWGLSIGNIKGVLIKTDKTITHDNKNLTIPFYLQHSEITAPITITFKLRK